MAVLVASTTLAASRYSLSVAATADEVRIADEVRAAPRLRYEVFAGECGARLHTAVPGLDVDDFDRNCDHLIVVQESTGAVVGTYRMLPPGRSQRRYSVSALDAIDGDLVETGRSCVHPDHRNGAVINLIWAGIARYSTPRATRKRRGHQEEAGPPGRGGATRKRKVSSGMPWSMRGCPMAWKISVAAPSARREGEHHTRHRQKRRDERPQRRHRHEDRHEAGRDAHRAHRAEPADVVELGGEQAEHADRHGGRGGEATVSRMVVTASLVRAVRSIAMYRVDVTIHRDSWPASARGDMTRHDACRRVESEEDGMTSWTVTQPERLDIDDEVQRLVVTLNAGRLNVVGTEGPARVEISKVGEATSVDVSVDNGVLTVSTPNPHTWSGFLRPIWWWLNGHRLAQTDVSIALPFGAMATLRLTSGAVIASGVHGELSVDVVSGRMTLLGNDGRLRGKVVSGPIDALGCAGDLTLETVSGEITIADSATQRVHARTISGALTADLDNPPRDSQIYLETTSGEITIRIREDSDLTVALSATSGRVTSAFPGLYADGGQRRGWGKRLDGALGAGTGRLRASAISGGISLLPRPVEDDGFTDGGGTR